MQHQPCFASRRSWLRLLALLTLVAVLVPSRLAAQSSFAQWEKDIRAFEEADKTNPPPKEATLFVGASNIRRWTSLADDFRGQKVINRGFGGSQIGDVLHFTDRIVLPYQPKGIVLQAGGNDLNAARTPAEVFNDFKAFVIQVHAKLPETRITYLSIPPSLARWAQVEKMRAANRLIEEFTQRDPRLAFIDLFPPMLGADGRPRAELFVSDNLHVNAKGYELWTSLVKWDKEIKGIEAADKTNAPPGDGIVFIGSSSIRLWKSLAQDFPEQPVINRGFGGSQLIDAVCFADRLVLPWRPKMIVLYAGGNDINAGKAPEQVFAAFKGFVEKIHASQPQTRIAYISIAPNPARWAQVEKVKAANRLITDYIKQNPRLTYIDVFTRMLGTDDKPLPDIYVADNLHLNAKGYALWTGIVKPYLK